MSEFLTEFDFSGTLLNAWAKFFLIESRSIFPGLTLQLFRKGYGMLTYALECISNKLVEEYL